MYPSCNLSRKTAAGILQACTHLCQITAAQHIGSLLHSMPDPCCTACRVTAAQHAASLLHSMLHHCCTACRITAAQHASSLLHSMLASKVPVNPACCCCMHFNVLTCFACIRKRPSAHNSERSCNVTDVRTVVCHSFAVFNRVRFEE